MWFSSETSQGTSILSDDLREGGQHGRRPAADDLGGAIASLQPAGQKLGDEAVVPGRAVVGRQLDLDAGATEVVDARQERGGPHTVEQGDRGDEFRDELDHGRGRRALLRHRLVAIIGLAEPPAAQGQERRLADAAGHEDDRSGGGRTEAVAERPPHGKPLAWPALREGGRSASHHQVDDVERGRRAGRVADHVVEGQRPAQQRVGRTLGARADHHELTGPDRPGHRRVAQPQPIGVASDRDVSRTGTSRWAALAGAIASMRSGPCEVGDFHCTGQSDRAESIAQADASSRRRHHGVGRG